MQEKELALIVKNARVRQDTIMNEKGADYTRHDPDRLANFKRLAKDVGVDLVKVWAIYAGKHWDAIMAFVKTGKVESEDIVGRIDDLHNYLYLFEAILSEREPEVEYTKCNGITFRNGEVIGVDDARDVDF